MKQAMEPGYEGNVRVFGEKDRIQIARPFARRLSGLSPTKRRLAIARACVYPWRDNPTELPDCYRHELAVASWEADEEDRARGGTPDHQDVDDVLSASDPDPPINEIFLRHLLVLSPAKRRHFLLLACMAPWVSNVAEAKRGLEALPEWIARTYEYVQYNLVAEQQPR